MILSTIVECLIFKAMNLRIINELLWLRKKLSRGRQVK